MLPAESSGITKYSLSMVDHALAAVGQGWPVVPCVKGLKAQKLRGDPTLRPDVVQAWWARRGMASCNPGIKLKALRVVVLDPDGSEGRDSLAKAMSECGVAELPETFTVTTGREDGGTHEYYAVPAGREKFNGQNGSEEPGHRYGNTPRLDVITNGIVVAPGARHSSGRVYLASGRLPQPEELPELPVALYDWFAARAPKVRSRAARRTAVVSVIETAEVEVLIPSALRAKLEDTRDGRNLRSYEVVQQMFGLGWTAEQIHSVYFAFPLSDRATKAGQNPERYLEQKIDSARSHDSELIPLNKAAVFAASRQLPPGELRVLDALLTVASPVGTVERSLNGLGLDAAQSKPAGGVRTLIAKGFLRRYIPGTHVEATTYLVHLPPTHHTEAARAEGLGPQLSRVVSTWSWGWHDAWRRKAGSLHVAYPLFTILTSEPQAPDELATVLGLTARAYSRQAKLLTDAGLVIETGAGLVRPRRSARDWIRILDAAAVACGTAGARQDAIDAMLAAAKQWEQDQIDFKVIGSQVWLKARKRDCLGQIERGCHLDIVAHFAGDMDSAAQYLAESHAATLHAPRVVAVTPVELLAVNASRLSAGAAAGPESSEPLDGPDRSAGTPGGRRTAPGSRSAAANLTSPTAVLARR